MKNNMQGKIPFLFFFSVVATIEKKKIKRKREKGRKSSYFIPTESMSVPKNQLILVKILPL